MPAWIGCAGFTGVPRATRTGAPSTADDEDTHLLVRGVAFPDAPRPGYAVVVDLLVNDAIRQQLRKDTGVELKSVTAGSAARRRAMRGRWPGRAGGDERAAAVAADAGSCSAACRA